MSDSDEDDYGRSYSRRSSSSSSRSSSRRVATHDYGDGEEDSQSQDSRRDMFSDYIEAGGAFLKDSDEGQALEDPPYGGPELLNSPGSDTEGLFTARRKGARDHGNSGSSSSNSVKGVLDSLHQAVNDSDWSPRQGGHTKDDSTSRSHSFDSDHFSYRFGDNDSDGSRSNKKKGGGSNLEDDESLTDQDSLPCCCVLL
ncbi:uncharacterized protein [Panulirus ornatus]|uniref:uncharacterized protein n=1 Tax=Panulirus ornatus TaxID=150431 RepID=UPI003A8471FC